MQLLIGIKGSLLSGSKFLFAPGSAARVASPPRCVESWAPPAASFHLSLAETRADIRCKNKKPWCLSLLLCLQHLTVIGACQCAWPSSNFFTSAVDFSRELSVGIVAKCSYSSGSLHRCHMNVKKKSDGIFKGNIFTLRRHAGCSWIGDYSAR